MTLTAYEQMHEKAHEMEECEEVFQATAKKFRHSKKVRTTTILLLYADT